MKLDDRLAFGLGLTDISSKSLREYSRRVKDRVQIAKNLGKVNMGYWGELKNTLLDDKEEVRGELALSLGRSGGGEEAIDILRRLADDRSWQVRVNVAQAAQILGDKSLLETVLQLFFDKNPEVQAAAFRAYLRLSTLYPKSSAELAQISSSHVKRSKSAFTLTRPKVLSILDSSYDVTVDSLQVNFAKQRPKVSGKADTNKVRKETKKKKRPEKRPAISTNEKSTVRYVNAWFKNHSSSTKPLAYGREYEMGVQISPKIELGIFTTGDLKFNEPNFDNQAMLEVTVALISEDFEVLEKSVKRMKLPLDRSQKSAPVTFRVKPSKNNQEVRINLLFYYKNCLFHEAVVGAHTQVLEKSVESSTTTNYPTENLFSQSIGEIDCDLNLHIVKTMEHKFRMIAFFDQGGENFDVVWCNLPVNQARVLDLLQGIRNDVLALVEPPDANSPFKVFQKGGESQARAKRNGRVPKMRVLDDNTYQRALERLSVCGRKLTTALFEPLEGTMEERKRVQAMGKTLTNLSSKKALRIQILSQDFFIPWNLIYDGKYPSKKIDPYQFWGFKHSIEEIPYQVQERSIVSEISLGSKGLRMGININRQNIAHVLSDPLLATVKSWSPKVIVSERFSEAEVLDTLCGLDGPHLIEYFYCHAGTAGQANLDFEKSFLGLTKPNTGLTLEEIQLSTPGVRFKDHPIFILNACESVQMDGRFYHGFVPKFMDMGASTVIGTDNKVPAIFGAHLGMALMDSFLRGKTIGAALKDSRLFLLKTYHNPLGLIYRIFGNTQIHLSKAVL